MVDYLIDLDENNQGYVHCHICGKKIKWTVVEHDWDGNNQQRCNEEVLNHYKSHFQ